MREKGGRVPGGESGGTRPNHLKGVTGEITRFS
jgi:hypothetical protein